MPVHGALHLNTGRKGVVISRDATLRYPNGLVTVWVVDPDAEPPTVSEKLVKTGLSFDGRVSIRRSESSRENVSLLFAV